MTEAVAKDAGEREAARRWRAERRRILRELHPDRGGDTEAYLAAMSAMPARCDEWAGVAVPSTTRASATMAQVLRRRWRQACAAARVRVPRSWPGARRYAQL